MGNCYLTNRNDYIYVIVPDRTKSLVKTISANETWVATKLCVLHVYGGDSSTYSIGTVDNLRFGREKNGDATGGFKVISKGQKLKKLTEGIWSVYEPKIIRIKVS